MAEKDLSGKKIEDYNDVFADIYNTLLSVAEIAERLNISVDEVENFTAKV